MDTILRRLRLRPEHLPVPIYVAPDAPIAADWVAIIHCPDENPSRERFVLTFLDRAGVWLEELQYETLEIALDQAADLLGVHPDEWEHVNAPLSDSENLGPWPGSDA